MTPTSTLKRAVLLAAGRGTRLGTLTEHCPKPMVLLAGKPILEHILLQMLRVGVTEHVVVVGYQAERVQDYFGDGTRWGIRIEYVLQPVANGTGAALALARDLAGSEPFLASFGDILTSHAHYRRLIASYTSAPCAAVLGINPVEDPSAGAAVTRDGDRVVKVVEKPPRGTAEGHWSLAGVSIYSPAVWPALADLEISPRGEYELTSAIGTLITAGQEVRAVEFNGFWSDVGTPEALHEADLRLNEL